MAHGEVTIHIDKKKFTSPNPTTGAALYALGGVDASKYDLFLEVPGPKDDVLVANDSTSVTLKDGAPPSARYPDTRPVPLR